MDNNSSVPVKTKIAAWMLIGLGVALALWALIAIIQEFSGGTQVGPISDSSWMLINALFWQALFLAIFSFIIGLLIFDQKRKLFLFSFIIFFLAYAFLFTTWRISAAPLTMQFQAIGCDPQICETNEVAAAFENNSMNWAYVLAGFSTGAILLIILLIYSGIALLIKHSKRAWFFTIAFMTMIVFIGMISGVFTLPDFSNAILIGDFGLIDLWMPILFGLIIPLAIIVLLLTDRKEFFRKKE